PPQPSGLGVGVVPMNSTGTTLSPGESIQRGGAGASSRTPLQPSGLGGGVVPTNSAASATMPNVGTAGEQSPPPNKTPHGGGRGGAVGGWGGAGGSSGRPPQPYGFGVGVVPPTNSAASATMPNAGTAVQQSPTPNRTIQWGGPGGSLGGWGGPGGSSGRPPQP